MKTRLLLAVLLILALAGTQFGQVRAEEPDSSCFRDFGGCRVWCVETYSPDEMDDALINDPEANMCLLDCDLDLAVCLVKSIVSAKGN